MIRLIAYAVLVMVLASVLLWLNQTTKPVSLRWDTYHLTLSPAIAVLGAFAGGLVFFLFYTLVWWLFTLGRRWRHFQTLRQLKHQNSALSQSIIALYQQDTLKLSQSLSRLKRLAPDNPATLLLHAEAAKMSGDSAPAQQAYTAMLHHPELQAFGLRGLLQQATAAQDVTAALAYARQAACLNPDDGATAKILLHLLLRQSLWDEALLTLKRLQQKKQLPTNTARSLRGKILLEQSRHLAAVPEADAALQTAKAAFESERTFAPARWHYAGLLARENAKAAQRLIERFWSIDASLEAARLYLSLTEATASASPQSWHKMVQSLTRSTPDAQGSLLLRAHAAQRLQDLSMAVSYLQRLIQRHPLPALLNQIALLEERLQHTAAAASYRHKARESTPPLAWKCQSCQQPSAEWQLVCAACHSIDTLCSVDNAAEVLPPVTATHNI